jgi:GTP cyclohydrolase I
LNPIDDNPVAAPLNGASIESLTTRLLEALGEDPRRSGLERTPERVARMYVELLAGYHVDPDELVNDALFEVTYDEMVIVKDIDYFSLCEHHLLPFYGRAHVAYLPDKKVLGLSKIPRIVDMYSRRLQVQERMTVQIADFLNASVAPRGVAVVVEGRHMCAMMRGVRKANAIMTTSSMLGAFRTNAKTRTELLSHLGHHLGD